MLLATKNKKRHSNNFWENFVIFFYAALLKFCLAAENISFCNEKYQNFLAFKNLAAKTIAACFVNSRPNDDDDDKDAIELRNNNISKNCF